MENLENAGKYDLIFEKLEEAKQEQIVDLGISEEEFEEIDESIKLLIEMQQSIDTETYTYFTRS